MYLPENIRYMRKYLNMSQEELADRLGYKSYTTIQKWESGVSEPPLKKLKQLAEIFDMDMDVLTNNRLMTEEEFLSQKVRDFVQKHPDNFSVDPIRLPEDIRDLITLYRKLNDLGRSRVLEYVTDLSDNVKYTEKS